MANYRLVPATLVVTPKYPTGQTAFTTNDDVMLGVKFTIQRDVSDPSWFQWGTRVFVKKASGELIKDQAYNFYGAPPSLTQDVDDVMNLGRFSEGVLNGVVSVQGYG